MRGITPPLRRANQVERLELRQLLSGTLQVGPTAPFHTIQAAVNAADKGDTIQVAPGTYVEQVVIPSSLARLTIQSSGGPGSTIIQAPATLTGSKAIVTDQADGFEISGFTIQGPANGISAGVLVNGASDVQIENNQIVHIHDVPLSGNQSGYGIEVMGGGDAQISGDSISDYQKNGIEVRDAGTTAEIRDVTVTGDGPTAVNTQNGIVFFSGAGGSVDDSTVSHNQTLQPNESGGILAFNSGRVFIHDNVAFDNDGNIILDGPSRAAGPSDHDSKGFPTGSVIEDNETYGAKFDGIALFDGVNAATVKHNDSHDNGFDGLLIDSTSMGNRIDSNVLINNNRSNVGAWDLEDDTFGQSNTIVGDGGTANFYKNDTFGTTNTNLRSKNH